tara:strand:- start:7420 stop:7848 length:429 start_codon:yes stop_codon:yes gene_type:complete
MNTNHKHVEELEVAVSKTQTNVNDASNAKALSNLFDENKVIHELHHYLPSQNPLKDFVHHNSLHSFQEFSFHEAIARANEIMGYKGYLQLDEYKALYREHKISDKAIEYAITSNLNTDDRTLWKKKIFANDYDENTNQRVGR